MLAAYDVKKVEMDMNINISAFDDHSKIFVNTLKSIVKSIVDDNQGDVLEAVGVSWLIARLVASSLNNETTISAERLLGISLADSDFYIPDIAAPKVTMFVDDKKPLPPISDSVKGYARQFSKNVHVSEAFHVESFYLQKGSNMT